MKAWTNAAGMVSKRGTLLACVAALIACPVHAGDYYFPVVGFPPVLIGPDPEGDPAAGTTRVDTVPGKEYSHTDWFSVYHGALPAGAGPGDPNLINVEDHDAFAVADPLQVVSWDGKPGPYGSLGPASGGPNSGSVDAFDFGSFSFNYPEGQVDALANRGDFLLGPVTRNDATLLFSTTADLDASTVLPPAGSGSSAGVVAKAHVHWEAPIGPGGGPGIGEGIWATIEAPPAGPATAPGPGVNHHVVEDLDALEVWGPEPPHHDIRGGVDPKVIEGYISGFGVGANTADADRFSIDNDALNGGVSVWAFDITTGVISPWVPHSEIVAAVETLFLGPGERFDEETRHQIDVDGTMARDVAADLDGTSSAWGPGDELLFTIDPVRTMILDPTGASVPGPFIDGGEVMHLVKTGFGPGAGTFGVSFLSHGGHLWDTAFPVATTFGYEFEDVDALEAVGTLTGSFDVPTPSAIAMATLAVFAVGASLRRRN